MFVKIPSWRFKGDDVEVGDLALRFARALVAGEYDKAHDFLIMQLQWQVSPADLEEEYVGMHAYAPEPPDTIELGQLLHANWPDAVGWQWVDIQRQHSLEDRWYEGVLLLVVEQDGKLVIGDIVWGRP